jgi:ketosteroid isomerase-like protein
MPMQKKGLLIPVFILSLLFIACNDKKQPSPAQGSSVDEIIDADIAFSELSKQKGMKNAFINFIDNEGILLRPDYLPVKGADAIEFLSQVNDSLFTLEWSPEGAQISESGDMGFTYGIYSLGASDTAFKGTYVNIWKKQPNGNWKFVMNTTNQGISPNE